MPATTRPIGTTRPARAVDVPAFTRVLTRELGALWTSHPHPRPHTVVGVSGIELRIARAAERGTVTIRCALPDRAARFVRHGGPDWDAAHAEATIPADLPAAEVAALVERRLLPGLKAALERANAALATHDDLARAARPNAPLTTDLLVDLGVLVLAARHGLHAEAARADGPVPDVVAIDGLCDDKGRPFPTDQRDPRAAHVRLRGLYGAADRTLSLPQAYADYRMGRLVLLTEATRRSTATPEPATDNQTPPTTEGNTTP